ncbi:uncharacterized protein LOC132707095 isoform X2 [Cylas formicarius]|uniref:uncharacterized protein LOC132707095 isoform X2 n=1 Tax=Cylas formicarius TaxID=197179 RepID=UPI002958CAD4|nr:uncharacterized protein LOC132707095 isoform X2 [Cylas formicarius]
MDVIRRLGNKLRPAAWKSDSQLSDKRGDERPKPLSRSTDWTDAQLEVTRDDDDAVHLKNAQLALIFDDDTGGTPTPPPRKNLIRRNLKEKIESAAKTGLQALQVRKPVEEELFVKKKIVYTCPVCEQDEKNHNRDHHHQHNHGDKKKLLDNAEDKRKKNLSVVSLPNYDDLKLSVATTDKTDSTKPNLNSSRLSLQSSKKTSGGKLDAYFNRCRSFGSLIPQQLKKLKTHKAPDDVESDDSFAGLEDWDLGLIEHYNPKEASLPRPRKTAPAKTDADVLAGIEDLVVRDDAVSVAKPEPRQRKTESLIKKIQREARDGRSPIATPEDVCLTPPPSPEVEKRAEPRVEHSGLMRILQEFSPRRKRDGDDVQVFIDAEKAHTGAGLAG